jgi:hypothetical protein
MLCARLSTTYIGLPTPAEQQAEASQSKPKDSPEHIWVEVTYDGKEDSEVLTVPHHWHKVRF